MLERDAEPSRYPPSALWAGLRMVAQAWIKSRPRDEGEAFLRALASVVADEEIVHPIWPNRPKGERSAQFLAQVEAAHRIRTALPLLVAALPPKLRRK